MSDPAGSSQPDDIDDAVFPNPLLPIVADLLRREGNAGISEYRLILALREHCPWIPDNWGTDSLFLYRLHCMLFNALYQLQREWCELEGVFLKISALDIRRMPLREDSNTLPDDAGEAKLAAFYLNADAWSDTDREAVEQLLAGFWAGQTARNGRDDALAVLGLTSSASRADIRRAYRRLVALHHPDRGGDTAFAQQLNEAVALLLRA